ncbi:VanZ family protein [Myceligenerans pegani]|uniref:VanZ family protein n=1 Tax=Myceligenerans pegani TaxID=2776917 RepID=A0ABR9N118_9MICO|nr:VanZ family protein [Myceligenerans sp. TRM 65318]MBE1877349.1 VanZ family protein [Myceligenerans sp. TRM 65318]MBE3019620.1 VanZ family protein [Myceligenerans sp. TRM 65318]
MTGVLAGLDLAAIAIAISLVAAAIAVVHHASLRSDAERAAEAGWILDVVLALHAVVYVWVTLGIHASSGALTPNLIPFTDLAATFEHWFTSWIPRYGLTQVPPQVAVVAGNFLLLAPFAAVAPLRWKALASGWRVIVAAAVIAGADEILQGVLGRGRNVSFDDVLVQVLGAIAIYGMTTGALNARERRLAEAESQIS